MAFLSRNYANAPYVSLLTEVSATENDLVVGPLSGWPVAPFWVVVERSTHNQEVMLVQAVTIISSTETSLAVERNADGNGGYLHGIGAGVELSGVAQDWQEFAEHRTSITRDDHPSLMMSDGTRHNLPDRHLLGQSIATGDPSISHLGDGAALGSLPGLARADHVHGRVVSADDIRDYFLAAGMIMPVLASQVAYPQPPPSGTLWCDGGWYPRSQYPDLYNVIHNAYSPYTSLQTGFSSLPAAVRALPGYQNVYDPAHYFAMPCLLAWAEGASGPIWHWSPPGSAIPLNWAIVADFTLTMTMTSLPMQT